MLLLPLLVSEHERAYIGNGQIQESSTFPSSCHHVQAVLRDHAWVTAEQPVGTMYPIIHGTTYSYAKSEGAKRLHLTARGT